MSAFPGSPRVLKGGLVLLDPDTFNVLPNGVIVLQYNPDTFRARSRSRARKKVAIAQRPCV